MERPAVGVLTVDHEGVGGTVETEAGDFLLVYASVTADVQDNEEVVAAELQAAIVGLRARPGLVALAADPLLMIFCEEAVRSAAAGLLLLPSPLLLAPLVVRTLEPSQQLLVLIDVSGIDDLEEMTPRLLNHGMGLHGADSERVIVEAVQGCCIIGSDPKLVAHSVLERVAQVGAAGGAAVVVVVVAMTAVSRARRNAWLRATALTTCCLPPPLPAQVQQEARIGAIMIDSPQLIPHAAALRRAADVPVFESLSALHCCSAARRVSLLPTAAARLTLTLTLTLILALT